MAVNSKFNVYVRTIKDVPYLIRDDNHTILHCGAAVRKGDFPAIKDNSGDNISELNWFYVELTGDYWVWKNGEKSDIVGMEHYRRHFNLSMDEVEKILSENDIIAFPLILGATVEQQYGACHGIADLKCAEAVVKELHPDYADDWDKYIKTENKLYTCNSYITTWDKSMDYYNFLFPILEEVRKRQGYTDYEISKEKKIEELTGKKVPAEDEKERIGDAFDYQTRIAGLLSERLFTLYIRHNFKNIHDCVLTDIQEDYDKNHMKVMLCTIARQENDYIREFVEYHKDLGVDNICIFDNNRDGEEDFHDVIGDYIDSGYVILKDRRNLKDGRIQQEAYNACYQEYRDKYDWFIFFDVDEFMFIQNGWTLKQYLAWQAFRRFNCIHVNLMCYGDGGMVRNDGRKLMERITEPIDLNNKVLYDFPENFHVSPIVRGGLKYVDFDKFAHNPNMDGHCCNGSGIECGMDSPFTPYDYRMAGVRHYTTKTAEEYIKKIKKGACDGTNASQKPEVMVDLFFRRNEATEEKVKLFKDELGVDFSYLIQRKYEGEKSKETQIYSLCYEKKRFPFMDTKYVTPLQVGAANGNDVCELKDNAGDNISAMNYFYVENTGTYWIWKNIHDAKYKGQMQYRRPLSGITDDTNFDELFEKYDVITCEPFNHPAHSVPTKEEPTVIPAKTVGEGYAFSNCIDDLYILEMAVKWYYPNYAADWDKYIWKGENLYYSNGFILKAEDYDKYAEFLFGCLNGYAAFAKINSKESLEKHVKYNLEVGKYPRYEGRKVSDGEFHWQTEIGGFLSERLWTLWLQHNFKDERILKLPYNKQEDTMWI